MSSTKYTLSALASVFASSLILLSAAPTVSAAPEVTPTAPGPGEVFTAGGQCSTSWDPATSNSWSNMTIELMTGSNTDMVSLATIATGLDGTASSPTTFTFTCPEVTPYSAVYFYQYTRGNERDPTWTTRFTIQSPDGTSTDPPNSTVSAGTTIYFGYGALVGSASDIAEGTAGTVEGTAAGTTTISATATGGGEGASPTSATNSSSSSNSSDGATRMTTASSTTSSSAANSTSSAGSNTTTSSSSAAASTKVVASLTALLAMGGAIIALA